MTSDRIRQAGVVALLTFGFAGLFAVLPAPYFVTPAIAVLGWFVVTPLVALYGLPGADEGESADAARDPLTTAQERYAAGEITEAEFERRVERILESEEAVRTDGRPPVELDHERGGRAGRERDPDLERDVE